MKNLIIFILIILTAYCYGADGIILETDSSTVHFDPLKSFDDGSTRGMQIVELPINSGMMMNNIIIYQDQGFDFDYNHYMGKPFFTYPDSVRQMAIEKWKQFYELLEKE
ncbi:MAG: hypothetical protein WD048_13145 [Chitinophagales bacterium]